MNNEATKAKIKLQALAIAEAIRELGSVPSGHLYARLMGQLAIEEYNAIIAVLKGAELVTEEAHVLSWIGGAR
jgi:hypothetical protein